MCNLTLNSSAYRSQLINSLPFPDHMFIFWYHQQIIYSIVHKAAEKIGDRTWERHDKHIYTQDIYTLY